MSTGTNTPNLGMHNWNGNDNVLRTEFNDNFTTIDNQFSSVSGTGHDHSSKGAQIPTAGIKDGAITSTKLAAGASTDTVIGNRTVDQTQVPTSASNTGALTSLLSWITNRIKAITGGTNWYDAPPTTLTALSANKLDASSYTAADVLAKFKTVDGAGSGADADTVDGYQTSTGTTASTIPVRDTSGNLPGNITGNAATATKWATGRTIALTGDVTGTSVAFDGSAALSFAATLAASGVTAGTYPKVTVDAKGRVTAGQALSAADIPGLDWSKITSGLPTTLGGYGITDALSSSLKGAANGVASLDGSGYVPASQLGNVPVSAMVKIQEIDVASNTTSVTFSNIPQSYRTLKLFVSARTDTTTDVLEMQINGLTDGNYTGETIYRAGNSTVSGAQYGSLSGKAQLGPIPGSGAATLPTFGKQEITFIDYSNTSSLAEWIGLAFGYYAGNNTSNELDIIGGVYQGSAQAISSIKLMSLYNANFLPGSKFILYGVI